MIQTGHRVLDTVDANTYLTIMLAFMERVRNSRSHEDIVCAAGVAEEELARFRDNLHKRQVFLRVA